MQAWIRVFWSGFGLLLTTISLLAAILVFQGTQAQAAPREKVVKKPAAEDSENLLFAYSHLQPSPLTMPGGRLSLGTQIAWGVTDFLQVGTDVIRDVSKIYNANAKLSLVETPEFALAATGGWEHYNLRDISSSNPDASITSWLPGLTMANAIGDQLALFYGGNINLTDYKINTDGIQDSGFLRGASLGSDLSWAYNPPSEGNTSRRGIGNVLSAGATYDITYKLLGVGLSHHWPGFKVGFHYYPGASKNRWLVMIAGGMSMDL